MGIIQLSSYLLPQGPAGCSDQALIIVVRQGADQSKAQAGLVFSTQVAEKL